MRLRLVQKDIGNFDLPSFVRHAAEERVDVVCFGELAATGCLYQARNLKPLDPLIARLSAFPVIVMFGAARQTAQGRRNSYLCVSGGRVQVYDKIHLFPPFNEDKVYGAGDAPGLFTTAVGDFGAAICYDLRFDEIFAEFKNVAVPRIVVPAAFPRIRIDQWEELIVRRARETGATVVGVNAVGDDGTTVFGGRSLVALPDGRIMARGDDNAEMVIDVVL